MTSEITQQGVKIKRKKSKEPKRLLKKKFKKAKKNEVDASNDASFEFIKISETLIRKYKWTENAQNLFNVWYDEFKTTLMSLPKSKLYELDDLSWLEKHKAKVTFPIAQELLCEKGKFQFMPPSSIQLVGSFPLHLSLKVSAIDVALEIPTEFWYNYDCLNGRYYKKRALYLCHLVIKLSKLATVSDMIFNYQHGDPLKPILLIKPHFEGETKSNIWVNLLPHAPPEFFKVAKFENTRNNVRPSWFFKDNIPSDVTETEPTPHYNLGILKDICMPSMLKSLQSLLVSGHFNKEGVLLLKHWLICHGLDQGYGNFGGFLMTLVVAYLVKKKILESPQNPFKTFKSVLEFLSESSWIENGIFFSDDAEFDKKSGSIVIMDPSNTFNAASFLSVNKARRVQIEAKQTLLTLELGGPYAFRTLFVPATSYFRIFDHVFHISSPSNLTSAISHLNLEGSLLDHIGNIPAALGPALESLLTKALGSRVTLLDRKVPSYKWWKVTATPPDPNRLPRLTFGILLNPDMFATALDQGPYGDQPEAKEFQKFWGPKSQLRRFKDGSIREALIWPGANFAEKRLVPSHIVKYILGYHAEIPEESIEYVGQQLETSLALPPGQFLLPESWGPYGTGEECALRVVRAFDALSRKLRSLQGFAQTVTSVQGLSSAFSFTQTNPSFPMVHKPNKNLTYVEENCLLIRPTAKFTPRYVEALEACFLLEGDQVWQGLPDLESLRSQKTLFYIAIADLLRDRCGNTTQPSPRGIDLIEDGFPFRLSLVCHKERVLLEAEKAEGEAKKLELHYVQQPRLVSLIAGVNQQYNTFGTSSRLAKRWLATQRLLGPALFPEMCVDLLMCHVYLSPSPFPTPNSPQGAFFRFLTLLASHNWASDPLIVNFNHELSAELLGELRCHLDKKRSTLPPMVIATTVDKSGQAWTRPHPTADILSFVVNSAKASLAALELQLSSHAKSFKIEDAFRPIVDDADVIIHLHPGKVPQRVFNLLKPSPPPPKPHTIEEYSKPQEEKIPVLNYDPPAEYLAKLQESYGDFANFLYDCYGGLEICIKWKASAFDPVPFSVSKLYGRIPDPTNPDHLIPNVEAILEDFKLIGDTLVKSIKVIHSHPQ